MTEQAAYPKEIATAIITVKKQVKQLGTNEENKHGGYSYVSVDKFYDRVGKLMAEAGLAILMAGTSSRAMKSALGSSNAVAKSWTRCEWAVVWQS